MIGYNKYKIPKNHSSLADLRGPALREKIVSDASSLVLIDRKMSNLHNFMEGYFKSIRDERPSILTHTQRKEIKQIWAQYLDLSIVLQKLILEYKHVESFKIRDQLDAYLISYAAYLLFYSSGLDIIENIANIAPFEVLFNEPIPEYGILRGQYTNIKWQIVHIEEFYELAEGYSGYKEMLKKYPIAPVSTENLRSNKDGQYLTKLIEERYPLCKQKLESEGISNLVQNILDTFKDKTQDVLFPIQKNFALFMGHTRLTQRKDGFISKRQCKRLIQKAKPGDILLERQEWYLSNLGIPGFWTHAALYIGSPEELKSWSNTSEIIDLYCNKDPKCANFSDYLERHYPEAYSAYIAGDDGEYNRIIEGLRAGIVFHSVSKSVGISDHAACLRPRLNKTDIAQAIEIAFQFWGREYDYTFNMLSDYELTCAELIYKSYEPASGKNGLSFDLSKIMGILTLPANNIAAQFDREYDTNPQLEFVLYYSCDLRKGKAYSKGLEAFRKTHKLLLWNLYNDRK
ncbi:MAG: hypothetical protein L6422_00225 [Candidatus Marinimicrobia bacterium]|nr:hypothetical protein [bacterium]MCG2714704.1 hypothetical protein [Candidatus Neomarinimicrobiota bacterium]